MTQPYPFTYTVDTQHANASAAKRLRSNGLVGDLWTMSSKPTSGESDGRTATKAFRKRGFSLA